MEGIKEISLSGGQCYITINRTDAFHVKYGRIFLYIVPVNKEENAGRRCFLYEAEKGEVLPSFFYRDADHCDWRFCFVASERAIIEIIENGSTKILRDRFAKKVNIKGYDTEGFDDGLTDYYRANIVTEDGFIRRTQKEREQAASKVLKSINEAIYRNKAKKTADKEKVYRQLLSEKSSLKELLRYCKKSVSFTDWTGFTVLSVLTAFSGMIIPEAIRTIFDGRGLIGERERLVSLGCIFSALVLSGFMLTLLKNEVSRRIVGKMLRTVQTVLYRRLFKLPESFFRQFESSELTQRIMNGRVAVESLSSAFFTQVSAVIGLTVCFAVMLGYSFSLTGTALITAAAYAALYYLFQSHVLKYRRMAVKAKNDGDNKIYQLLTGISKIRIAGAEDRALYEYMKSYIELRDAEERSERASIPKAVLQSAAKGFFPAVIFYAAICQETVPSIGTVAAFMGVFGVFAAYTPELVDSLICFNREAPYLEQLAPILEKPLEDHGEVELLDHFSGSIEVKDLCFSYPQSQENVIENLSLSISSGEYVGIVGESGCGKSTLFRLLLGFEKPSSGSILFDGNRIERLDKRSLRGKIGIVLQNGKLISGSILENITVTNPNASAKNIETAIERAGLNEDIEKLPMGLYTMLCDNSSGLSGGQRQRILIARALISDPKLLLFDEATSALDNAAQKTICHSLGQMNITRIVIAHRLSTVIDCNKIIVMDSGKIAEQGTYSELMEKKGLFYRLASRQK